MPVKVESPIINFYGLKTPFRCGLFGSSRTGKTTMIYNLLKKNLFDSTFSAIYYCYPSIYSNELDWHNKLDYTVHYLDYLPNAAFFKNIEKNALFILDDCWYSSSQDPNIRDLFKVLSGKKNISVFITSQNPFEGGSNARTIRNNLNYYLLFRNLGDKNINKRLTSQLGFLNQYELASSSLTDKQYDAVLINLDVTLQNEQLRVSSNILDTPIITV